MSWVSYPLGSSVTFIYYLIVGQILFTIFYNATSWKNTIFWTYWSLLYIFGRKNALIQSRPDVVLPDVWKVETENNCDHKIRKKYKIFNFLAIFLFKLFCLYLKMLFERAAIFSLKKRMWCANYKFKTITFFGNASKLLYDEISLTPDFLKILLFEFCF